MAPTYAFLALMLTCCLTAAMHMTRVTIDEALMQANSNLMSGSGENGVSHSSGDILTEIDIMMPRSDFFKMNRGGRMKRKAIAYTAKRWPNAVVPFEISSELEYARENIMSAIAEYHKYTCLKFKEDSSASSRIRFFRGDGCWSYVGRQGGVQLVSIGTGCNYKRTIIHEIGHAIGLHHEQTRPDRDEFVTINTENIEEDNEYNFKKYTTSQQNIYNIPYDFTSVMHYGQYAFTKNGEPTITAHTSYSRFQDIMGKREGLSFRDIQIANTMYGCSAACPKKYCGYWGFVGPDCKCWRCTGNYVTGVPIWKGD